MQLDHPELENYAIKDKYNGPGEVRTPDIHGVSVASYSITRRTHNL
jgi:hypothetical protein